MFDTFKASNLRYHPIKNSELPSEDSNSYDSQVYMFRPRKTCKISETSFAYRSEQKTFVNDSQPNFKESPSCFRSLNKSHVDPQMSPALEIPMRINLSKMPKIKPSSITNSKREESAQKIQNFSHLPISTPTGLLSNFQKPINSHCYFKTRRFNILSDSTTKGREGSINTQLGKTGLKIFKNKETEDTEPISKNENKIFLDKINKSNDQIKYIAKFYAESYKGKRPYNEDRYICSTKGQSLREKLKMTLAKEKGEAVENIDCSEKDQELLLSPSFRKSKVVKESLGNAAKFSSSYEIFAVFDGHGGSKCSEFLKQNFSEFISINRNVFINPSRALTETFAKLQANFLSMCEKKGGLQVSGSCAVVCFIKGNHVYVANLGDSRALLMNDKQIKQLTKDHKPDEPEEKSRIIRNGGKLYKDGSAIIFTQGGKQNYKVFNQTRIMPSCLNVSRTLGDIEAKYKKYGGAPGIISAEPEIMVANLESYECLLLASDGLFEGLTNAEVHQIYLKCRLQNADPQAQSKKVVKLLIEKSGQKSTDNITVICVALQPINIFQEA